MEKYAKIVNQTTKEVMIGIGTNTEYYKSIGMTIMDVEQAYNGMWYLSGYAPAQPAPTEEEQRAKREKAYTEEIDPITAHIQRLRDEEQTPEIQAEIEVLIAERNEKVRQIKERYPYPVGA